MPYDKRENLVQLLGHFIEILLVTINCILFVIILAFLIVQV